MSMLLLFATCEARGWLNIASGSPQKVAKTFLENLAEGKADYGWHLLTPLLRHDVPKDEYVKAVQASNLSPFEFEVLNFDTEDGYLAQAYVLIRFAHPVTQWPPVLDQVLIGRFVSGDNLSIFRGRMQLRKERFRWLISECCG
jgi:hypothetical protein